jgi:hypothetical protein
MRLQNLYFVGALAAAATPLSVGAQSLPANDQWTTNAQADDQLVQRCPPALGLGAGRISRGRHTAPGALPVAQ